MKLSRFNRILLETLFLPVIALLCVSGVLVWQILRAERTVAQMQTADQNIATIMRIEALLDDEETGIRGYQTTANDVFLEPYTAAAVPLQRNFGRLRDGLAGQPGDLRSLDALEQAHQRWLAGVAVPMMAMTRSGGNTRDLALNLRAKVYMDAIRSLETSIITAQRAKRTYLVEHWKQQLHHTLEAIVSLALVIGLLIGAFARNRLHLVSNAFQATLEEQRRTQAALLASEKLAVAGRLAATIAHEIHNPLDSVVNLLYLMKHSALSQERDEFIDMAQAELTRVTQISRAMLGMYRESKNPVALDISEILTSVLVLLDHQIAQAGLSIDVQLPPDAVATGYPAELRQVFTNLLTNAVEASSSCNTILVHVSRCSFYPQATTPDGQLHPSGPGVLIAITDTGPGISPADKQRLFHPFFTTKGEQGTGLGLWISHGIVQKHNGAITVDTSTASDDHGTTMTVFLPRGEAQWLERSRAAAGAAPHPDLTS